MRGREAPDPGGRGHRARRTHDYVPHGTRDLFAALDVRAGTVVGEVHARHRGHEFRHPPDTAGAATPHGLDLHLILDNAATHETALIKHWAPECPRVHLHFTPTSAAWFNRVERCFSLRHRHPLARAAFASRATDDVSPGVAAALGRTAHVQAVAARQTLLRATTSPSDAAGHAPRPIVLRSSPARPPPFSILMPE